MGLRELAAGRAASTLIFDPEMIEEFPGYNTRDMESESIKAHIRMMADAIKENGNDTFPPITIYQEGEKIYVMAGWCRRRAHILAKQEGADIKGILCLNAGKKSQEEMTLDILNSNDGFPLTQLEKAVVIKRLIKFSWTPTDIAKKKGWSLTTVLNLLALLDAPQEIKQMVHENKISATEALREVRNNPAEAPERLRAAIDKAKADGKPRATRKHIQKPENKLETVLRLIRGLSDEDFEELRDKLEDEVNRRYVKK